MITASQSAANADKILIVDDRRENLVALRQVLSGLEVEIVEATNGNDALTATLYHEFALAILDVAMPGMDGYELASLLRSDPRTQRLPIIFLTASHGEEQNIFQGYAAGAVDYIVKPYSAEVLQAKVRLFLELHRTNRSLAEKVLALTASEERFRSLVMTVPDIVYRIDDGGHFTFLNIAVRRLGYTPEELMGRHFSELLPTEEVSRVSREHVLPEYCGQVTGADSAPKLFDERRSGSRQTSGLQIRLRVQPHKASQLNGSAPPTTDYISVEVNSSGMYCTLPDQGGSSFIGTVGVIRDISERNRFIQELESAREEAEKGSQVKSAFLATMSHEIRTPMNGVVGLLDILSADTLSAPQAQQVETARESAESLLRIIDDILDFSKLEAGKLAIHPAPCTLSEVVNGVCTVLAPLADKRQVSLAVNISPRLPPQINSDDVRLRQILYNLVGNAIKFSATLPDREGRVVVQVEPDPQNPQQMQLSIKDNGIGMDLQTLESLFQPFAQADSSTTRRYGGTGLGLAICQQLVELLSGKIHVESEPECGTTFTVILPCEAVTTATAQPVPNSACDATPRPPVTTDTATAANAKHIRILVAEDDEINQSVILQQLSLLGYAAEVAEDGEAALQKWNTGQYTLLLTDLHMPKMDGYTLAKTIRSAEAPNQRMPILMLSANASSAETSQALEAGIDAYLTKPVRLKTLSTVLGHWLQQQATPPAAKTGDVQVLARQEPARPPALDLAQLKALVGDDPTIIHEILVEFMDMAECKRKALREAQASGELSRLSGIAHQLTSSCRSVGAMALSDIYAELEHGCCHAGSSQVTTLMARADAEWATLEGLISCRVRQLASNQSC